MNIFPKKYESQIFADLDGLEKESYDSVQNFFKQRDLPKDVTPFLPLEAQELIPHLREVFLGKSKKLPKVKLNHFRQLL